MNEQFSRDELLHQNLILTRYIAGCALQYKQKGLDFAWEGYTALEPFETHEFDFANNAYRIAPVIKKSMGYRRFLIRANPASRACVNYLLEGYLPDHVSGLSTFIRWIDTDWQYHEYED